jgi:hypothetical protein
MMPHAAAVPVLQTRFSKEVIMRSRVIVWSLITLVMVSCGLVWAGAKGPKPKLPAPENVLCPLTADGVVVSFDTVADAAGYQVEYLCVDTVGEFSEESEFVLASPVTLAPPDCTILSLHVRALPGPKHEGGPLQGGGPKGEWSDPCVPAMAGLLDKAIRVAEDGGGDGGG